MTFLNSRIILSLGVLACALSCGPDAGSVNDALTSVIYEGIDGYGVTDLAERKDSFSFRFHVTDSCILHLRMATDSGRYTLQNRLKEGFRFGIRTDGDGVVTALEELVPVARGRVGSISDAGIMVEGRCFAFDPSVSFTDISLNGGGAEVRGIPSVSEGDMVSLYGNPVTQVDRRFTCSPYTPPVTATPGLRTIRNFLKTAMMPCGTTLYIYGGGWDWQDKGSCAQSRTIGVPEEWTEFFQMNARAPFIYKNPDATKSYYPFHGYNEYHCFGSDCSGFVGWTIYNVMNRESGMRGFVMPSGTMAGVLAQDCNFGSLSRDCRASEFRPGDIMSMNGHVWICVGRARDGSLVIVHSTVDGSTGSGIQLSALGNGKDCAALRLADTYMKRHFPAWSGNYNAVCKDITRYTTPSAKGGRFSWSISPEGLEDPDGYLSKTAEEILSDLFGEIPRSASE